MGHTVGGATLVSALDASKLMVVCEHVLVGRAPLLSTDNPCSYDLRTFLSK